MITDRNGATLEAVIRECWASAEMERLGVGGARLTVLPSGESYGVLLRHGGLLFWESLGDLDFDDSRKLVRALDRGLIRLTSRAKRYLRRTPRCYYPKPEEIA